jgi:hypothetical protein
VEEMADPVFRLPNGTGISIHCNMDQSYGEYGKWSLLVVKTDHQRKAMAVSDVWKGTVPKGGLVCNQMGTGKTLILSELVRLRVRKEKLEVPLRRFPFWKLRLRTLVVVPDSVASFFIDEWKRFQPDGIILPVFSHTYAASLTLRNLLDADAIVISETYMEELFRISGRYTGWCTETKNRKKTETVENMNFSAYDKSGNLYPLESTYFYLMAFKFERIILDEFHRYKHDISTETLAWILEETDPLYRWGVTGTPEVFMDGDPCPAFNLFFNLEKSRKLNSVSEKPFSSHLYEFWKKDLLSRFFYRAIETDMTEDEHLRPLPPVHHTVFLQPTRKERIYWEFLMANAFAIKDGAVINTSLARTMTSGSADDAMFDTSMDKNVIFESLPGVIQGQIDTLSKDIERLKKVWVGMQDDSNGWASYIKFQADTIQSDLRKYELRLERNQSLLKEINNNGCSVCYDDLNQQAAKLEPCGHSTFCPTCIHRLIDSTPVCRCPLCRTPFIRSQVVYYQQAEEPLESPGNISPKWIDQYGTKVSALAHVLLKIHTENTEARTILYCAYDGVIQGLRHLLSSEPIRLECLNGNVRRRRKLITDWRNGKLPVLIFSPSTSSDGMNLQDCTHLLLAHPIVSHDLDMHFEKQAVKRVVRYGKTTSAQIIRFILNDTWETNCYQTLMAHGITQESPQQAYETLKTTLDQLTHKINEATLLNDQRVKYHLQTTLIPQRERLQASLLLLQQTIDLVNPNPS